MAAQHAPLVFDVEAARQLAPERAARHTVMFQTIDVQPRIGARLAEAVAVAGHAMGQLGRLDAHVRAAPFVQCLDRMEVQLVAQPALTHAQGGAYPGLDGAMIVSVALRPIMPALASRPGRP